MMNSYSLLVIASLLLSAHATLHLTNVTRHVDLTTNIARTTTTLEFSGSGAAFDFLVPHENVTHLAAITAKQGDHNLHITQGKVEKGHTHYTIKFASPLKANDVATVTVETVIADAIVPFPTTISLQRDPQLVIYYDRLHLVSPYPIAEERTIFKLSTSTIESNTKDADVNVNGDVVTYGPYSDVEPFSDAGVYVHYRNDFPFFVAENVRRILQVSHWGVLQVEEHVELRHVGVEFTGSFSRLESQRVPPPTMAQEVSAHLHGKAADIYFRDSIGNISTSTLEMHYNDSKEVLELKMAQRFPMFGGWKTDFYYGYNLPLSEVADQASGHVKIVIPFETDLHNIQVRKQSTEIILPEKISNVVIKLNGEKVEAKEHILKTYLDWSGRPTYRIEQTNIVTPDESHTLEISYDYSSTSALREPLMITFAFLAIFAVSGLLARKS